MTGTATSQESREPTNERPRFVVDKMLGRLARWLRILGCDTEYGPHLAGAALLRRARSSGRILLTRDRHLVRKAGRPPHRLIRSDHFREQLREVVEAFDLDPYRCLFDRCVECNGGLERVSKEAVEGRVPEYVFRTQDRFHRCRSCGHLYWGATHVERVRVELERMGFPPPETRNEESRP